MVVYGAIITQLDAQLHAKPGAFLILGLPSCQCVFVVGQFSENLSPIHKMVRIS